MGEVARGTKFSRLVEPRHLLDGQAFGKRDAPRKRVAARNRPDDIHRAHRTIEAVLARLEALPTTSPAERGTEGEIALDHSGIHQSSADGIARVAGWDVDELLVTRVSLVRRVH